MGSKSSKQGNTDSQAHGSERGNQVIEKTNLSREEQYDWFKFLRDSSEDEVIQHIKDNIRMCTAVMHFKIYSTENMYRELKLCSCAFDLEQGHSSSESPISALKLLEYCIQFGECPHYILDRCGYDDILNQTICVEDIYEQNVIDKEGSHSSYRGTRSAGLYWIHLLLILGRTRIVIEVLNFTSLSKSVLYTLFTCIHKFSPLHLALIHHLDRELAELLPHFQNLVNKGYIGYKRHWNSIGDVVSVLEISIDGNKTETLKNLIPFCNIKASKALEYAASKRKLEYIALLKDKGLSMSGAVFLKLAEDCIRTRDMEWLSTLLDLREAAKRQEFALLLEAVKYGCKDTMVMILSKLFTKRKMKRPRKLFQMECFVYSLILHDFEKFEILMEYGMDYTSLLFGHNILWWAETFGQYEILRLIKEKGTKSFPQNIWTDDPFDPLFNINKNVLENLKHLFEHGWDINGKERDGSPLTHSLRCNDEKVVRYLIENGAKTDNILKNPSCLIDLQYTCMSEGNLNLKCLMCIFVDFNVELSSNGGNSFVRFLSDYPRYFEFVLLSAYTIKPADRHFLLDKFIYTDTSDDDHSKNLVEKVLFSPKILSTICRDSLRSHYERKFPKFINIIEQKIPNELLKILRCEAIKDIFIETAEDNLITRLQREEFPSVFL